MHDYDPFLDLAAILTAAPPLPPPIPDTPRPGQRSEYLERRETWAAALSAREEAMDTWWIDEVRRLRTALADTYRNPVTAFLHQLANVRSELRRQEQIMAQLIAYLRERSDPPPPSLSTIAEASGVSRSGVRNTYEDADLDELDHLLDEARTRAGRQPMSTSTSSRASTVDHRSAGVSRGVPGQRFDGPTGTQHRSNSPDTQRGLFDSMGITDIDTYDPRPLWEKNERASSFKVPIGFLHDGTQLTDEYVYLDITDAARGGTGPHGVLQGRPGSGKSAFLTTLVEQLCLNFGPDTLNMILLDFNDGAGFRGMEKLPHVVACVSGMRDHIDLVDRVIDIVAGEISRRQTIFKQHGATDIFEYRKMYFREPDKYPRMPELVIIGDEHGELMMDHREYTVLFAQVARVGRALGIHVLASSQVIDPSLLGDTFAKQVTYGISYSVGSESESRHVIKNGEAAHLPFGSYRAILLYNDPQEGPLRKQFVAFDATAKYADTGSGHHDPASENSRVRDLFIDRISMFPSADVEKLWHPPLTAPISFHDVTVEEPQTPDLEFTVGVLDDPFNHRTVPWTVHPESKGGHIKIVGSDRSGRTTAVQSLVLSSAVSYPPEAVSWLLIDYSGTRLSAVAESPNVSGYTVGADGEKVDRFVNEALRIRDLREKEFNQRGITSFDSYLSSRADTPVSGDPYGHIFLAIDGYTAYLTDHDEDRDVLMAILESGGRYGVHLVVTVKDEIRKFYRHAGLFDTAILLRSDDPNTIAVNRETKTALGRIPLAQPGRGVDPETQLSGRILVPQRAEITPSAVDEIRGIKMFDSDTDFSPEIASLAQELKADCIQRRTQSGLAVQVEAVPHEIDYEKFLEGFVPATTSDRAGGIPERRRQMDAVIPLGVATYDLSGIALPKDSPNLIIAGEARSGKTTALRSLIGAVVDQFTPDEAQIIIVDPRYGLLDTRDPLAESGYLLGYTETMSSAVPLIEGMEPSVYTRFPDDKEVIPAEKIRGRTWYTGPELFIVVDNVDRRGKGIPSEWSPGELELVSKLTSRTDIGVHFYMSTTCSNFGVARTSHKFLAPVTASGAPLMMLSGPRDEGNIVGRIKFAKRRPGQGMFCGTTGDGTDGEVVQIPFATSWDDALPAPVRKRIPAPDVDLVD